MSTNETEDEDEDDIGVSWSSGSKGPDREEMMNNYLPEQDDWLAKTILEINDPGRVATLSQFGTMFPEVEDLQPLIDVFLYDLLKGRTSIGGQSRDDFRAMITSMYGGGQDGDKGSMLADALAADLYDDD